MAFRPNSARWPAVIGAVLLASSLAVSNVQAASFDRDADSVIQVPTLSACPTLTQPPRSVEAWFNVDDMEVRGFYDPLNNRPWDFAKKIAQVICGAAANSEIKIGLFFIRAIGTMTQPGLKATGDPDSSLGKRPETDPEVIYDALEYVHKKRNVKIGLVLDGGSISSASAKAQIKQRLLSIAGIDGINSTEEGTRVSTRGLEWCSNGCFNTNSKKVFPYAINHEKFVTISDTIWDRQGNGNAAARPTASALPVVISSSGNWARSQIRNYEQELTVIYADRKMSQQLSVRYDGMANCARTGCKSNKAFPSTLKKNLGSARQRGIWVDQLNPHITDKDRGTSITFSPQPLSVTDPYIQAFDNVNCAVDKRIRIAMFKLTDTKAQTMSVALSRLAKRGCDVKMLMTQQGGATTISKKVIRTLKRANISFRCTAVAMHTKLILIGPQTGSNGRVLLGTANMSTSGLRYSEEHTVTFDARRAAGQYQADLRRVYGTYLEGWNELGQGSRTCK
ncbi:MAG: phospholipase D family protein [Propionicimonas sp.]